MTSAELQIIIAELREQNELNRREHALNRREHLLNRREHRLNRQMHEQVLTELERQGELNRREHALSRRAYDEGLALCARLVAQSTAAMQEFARAMDAVQRRTASMEAKVDFSVEEARAGTRRYCR